MTAVSAGALLSGGAWAQSAQPDAGSSRVTQIGEVVVTAQRRSQNIQDVPISVQALSSKELVASGVKSTQDLGEITPNVTIISPIGAGNQPLITIRGIGLNDFNTNNSGPNGVYVDDVYISAPGAQTFALFDVSQVQVLKGPQGTLYGRNTSGGAIVFNSIRPTDVFSADLHGEYGNYNTLQLSGAVSGPLTDTLKGRVSFVVNRSDGYTKNAFTGGSPIDNVSNEAIRFQLQYQPNDKLKLYFESTTGYLRNHPQPYGHIGTFVPGTQASDKPQICSVAQAYAGGCVDMFGYGTPDYWRGSYSRLADLTNFASINQFRADYTAGPVVLTSITSWQYDDKYHPEGTDASPNDLVQATFGVHSNTWTQEFRAAHNSKDLNWVGGLYYLHENLRQNQPLSLFYNGDLFGGNGFLTGGTAIPPGPGAFDGIAQLSYDHSRQITDSAAVFGQGDYTYQNLTLTLGARYTWERKSFDYNGSTQFQLGGLGHYGPLMDIIPNIENSQTASNFTWRTALAYHFSSHIQAYGSVATGFKSGGFNGSFLSNDIQQVRLQLQPIKPEHVMAFELGEKATFFDRRLLVNTALFYNDYRNQQIFATVPQTELNGNGGTFQNLTQILTNAKRAHTEGVEVQLTATPFHGLTIDLEPAWLRTRLDDAQLPLFAGPSPTPLKGNELSNSPKFTFVAIVDYKYDLANGDDIDFRWNSNYRSHYWFEATNDPFMQQSGYWLHNMNITYQSAQHWEAGIFVRNLMDKKYQLTSSELTVPFGFLEPVEGPPTMWGAQLTFHY